jgi:alkylhydroperoxidase family enzyme
MPKQTADAVLANYKTAEISDGLRATLGFLDKMTRAPEELDAQEARTVLDARVSRGALEDAIAVATLFAVITRYANALQFAIPTEAEFDKAADMLLKRGYR